MTVSILYWNESFRNYLRFCFQENSIFITLVRVHSSGPDNFAIFGYIGLVYHMKTPYFKRPTERNLLQVFECLAKW